MTAPDSGPEESVSTGSRPEARLVTRCPYRAGWCEREMGHGGDHYTTYRDDEIWTLPAAASAEGESASAGNRSGLREALERHIEALVALGRTMVLRADLAQIGEQVAIVVNDIPDLRAALARQGEAELSEFRHHESAGSE